MKLTIWQNVIELDVDQDLTVRHMRKIYPLIKKYEGNEIEMVIEVVKALSTTENVETILDNMSIEEFTELSIKITELLEKKK